VRHVTGGTTIALNRDVMEDACTSHRFDELPQADQHTVQTYIDELARRDTIADAVVRETLLSEEEPRESQVYALPDAMRDRQGVMTLFDLLEAQPA
jgi:hypothetical protein